jgi:uncharacterized protein YaiL (DUF2058 family)
MADKMFPDYLIIKSVHWEEHPEYYKEKYRRSTRRSILYSSDPYTKIEEDIEKEHERINKKISESDEETLNNYSLKYNITKIDENSEIEINDGDYYGYYFPYVKGTEVKVNLTDKTYTQKEYATDQEDEDQENNL